MYNFHFKLHVHFNDSDDNIDSLMRSTTVSFNDTHEEHSFAEVGETYDGEVIYSASVVIHSPSIVSLSYGTALRAFFTDDGIFNFVAANFPNIEIDEAHGCIDFWLDCWEFTIRNSYEQIVCSNELSDCCHDCGD